MTANDLAMQLQADILGVPVSRPVVAETTALGAAYAAGLAAGFWRDTGELRANWHESRRWEPDLDRGPPRGRVRRLAQGRPAHPGLGGRRPSPRPIGRRAEDASPSGARVPLAPSIGAKVPQAPPGCSLRTGRVCP